MIQFEIDAISRSVELLLDSEGVDELVRYLEEIRRDRDHIHLTIGHELSSGRSENGHTIAQHVKIVFIA